MWIDTEIFHHWLNNIWFRESIYKSINNILLNFDIATSHFTENSSLLFNKYKSKCALIPPGMTRFLLPPDLSINKQFKTYMYHNDWKIQNEYKLKSTGDNIIDWVV